MSERNAKHATFVVERTYKASPERVFAAWATKEAKSKWFQPPVEFEFKVGGKETTRGGPPGGPVYSFYAVYQDIVPNERIVYSYAMDMNEARISASVTTVVITAEGSGTKLVFTEQGVFLDGHDTPEQREHGTGILLDNLGKELSEQGD
jgi:uncharacterized protein YndB with AHSA1/START domain